jgi:hypothetical protein
MFTPRYTSAIQAHSLHLMKSAFGGVPVPPGTLSGADVKKPS